MKKIKTLFLFLILIYHLIWWLKIKYISLTKTVLNESKLGAAQEKLVKEFENQDKKFKNESNALKTRNWANKRKTLSADEYKKKVSSLKKKMLIFKIEGEMRRLIFDEKIMPEINY